MTTNHYQNGGYFALCYVSDVTTPFPQSEINSLVRDASDFNRTIDVTGFLYYKDNLFFQYLEGLEDHVIALMEKIKADPRHTVNCIIEFPCEEELRFADWSMLSIGNNLQMTTSLMDPIVQICRQYAGKTLPANDVPKSNVRVLLDCLANDSFRENVESEGAGVRIIAIGASAGGIAPIRTLLSALPKDVNAAILVVLHFSPNHETVLDEILERDTDLPVRLAQDGDTVSPGVVYLIPPSKNLKVVSGRISISDQHRDDNSIDSVTGCSSKIPFPIDILFANLADQYGKKVIGVLLSGSGSDGTRGAKRLQEVGAIVIAQNPDTAEFDRLPASAINANAVDKVLEPDQIAGAVLNLLKLHSHLYSQPLSQEEFLHVESILSALVKHDIDFTGYKRRTIINRIRRRRTLLEVEDLSQYHDLIVSSQQEREELKNDLLICVTDFFRDKAAWDALQLHVLEKVVPLVLSVNEDTIRVWVPGCATGEEAYSIAIMLEEILVKEGISLDYKIFASDLSEKSLEIAAEGEYKLTLTEMLPDRILNKYFVKTHDSYQVISSIRERVITVRHNLVEDPPFTNMHLVTCRNLMIYMDNQFKYKSLKTLHFSLIKGGLLFIGPSESLGDLSSEFETINQQWNIHLNKSISKLPLQLEKRIATNWKSRVQKNPTTKTNIESKRMTYKNALEGICKLQSKTALVLDSKLNVELVVSDPNSLLEVGSGAPSSSIEMLLVKSLVKSVVVHLQQLDKLGKDRIVAKSISCTNNQGESVLVNLEIVKLESDTNLSNWMLTFSPALKTDMDVVPELIRAPVAANNSELEDLQTTLYETVQELEISDKEQQLAVEQLTTANEELQSTNEELQSVNEELYTVNFEYQSKIHELSDLTADMNNLMSSTDMGVIFLDGNLCIRDFNEQAAAISLLSPADTGRPIQIIAKQLDYQHFADDAARVISLGEPVERDIDYNDCAARLHIGIYPYKVDSEFAQGALVTMMDLANLQSFQVDTSSKLQADSQPDSQIKSSGIVAKNTESSSKSEPKVKEDKVETDVKPQPQAS